MPAACSLPRGWQGWGRRRGLSASLSLPARGLGPVTHFTLPAALRGRGHCLPISQMEKLSLRPLTCPRGSADKCELHMHPLI